MRIITLFLAAFFLTDINAQISEKYQTYNVNRAIEELDNGNEAEAKKYIEKELAENPKNLYAMIWMGALNGSEGEQWKGLSQIDDAIKKYLKRRKT